MNRARATFRALRHRNYRLFFFGQLVSLIGTWMQSVAQAWLAYRLTGSAALLGVVAFSGQIPAFLFASWGGVVADRWPRRRILLATQVASMLLAGTLAGLTLSNRIEVPHLLVIAALLGVVNAFDIPARQAFVVEMVGREDLINAIALNSSIFNGARVVGPALAGVLVARFGEGWCFLLNATSYLAVLASLLAIDVPEAAGARPTGSTLSRIVEGFRYAAAARPVRALLLLLGVVSLTAMPFSVLMPIFADRILGGGAASLGLLMGASGVGALAGALVLASRRGIAGLGRFVALSAAGFGVCLVLFSLSRRLWLSVALQVPVGFFMISQMASSNTLIQSLVPDRVRGRVMALYTMMFMGMAPFGALLAGMAVVAVLQVLFVLFGNWPARRR
ncbi:MAG: MFS transporter [Thermoanaerobaculia bacterium]|nr:MFS transporter [Thermoanaerobaculia bacterium]